MDVIIRKIMILVLAGIGAMMSGGLICLVGVSTPKEAVFNSQFQ
jgi:hypothetical protein